MLEKIKNKKITLALVVVGLLLVLAFLYNQGDDVLNQNTPLSESINNL